MYLLRNKLTQNVVLPLSDLFTGQSINSSLRFLLESHSWSRDRLIEHQLLRLKYLVAYCYANVPFYAKKMREIGIIPSDIRSIEDLAAFPIVTKEELRLYKQDHKALNVSPKSYIVHSSSGSTGEPFQYRISKAASSFTKAAAIRGWIWNGYSLGDKYVKISMNPRKSTIKQIQDILNRCMYLSATELTQDSFRRILEAIVGYDPKFIRGYPVPMFFLANLVNDKLRSYMGKSLIGINTTGSTLSDGKRAIIESAFGVKIFDSYSCEAGANFTQCPLCGKYHPGEEYAISEFIADEYTKNDPDRPLRHITTDLYNLASPFIRYDTQDYVVLDNTGDIQCSRPYKSVTKIKGRDGDIIVTPSRKFFIVENFVAYFEYIKEVEMIQVVQTRVDHIEINLKVFDTFSKNIEQEIKTYWEKQFGPDTSVSINVVDQIKLTSTGKRRTVIRDKSIDLL